ncbi:ATP-binding protein [Pseudomonas aeruginosa]|uniref:ATP-binding protein n=1 Tax=Pseudomonas aeruginosa TaxID=287 RepID=UPI003D2E7887
MDDPLLDLTAQLEGVDLRLKSYVRQSVTKTAPDAAFLQETVWELMGGKRWAREVPGWDAYPWRGLWRPDSRLAQLIERVNLRPFERDVLLLCVLPMLDLRYAKLFSVLRVDSHEAITVELALTLLCDDFVQWREGVAHLRPGAPLFRHCLLKLETTADRGIQARLRLEASVFHYLLGHDFLPQELELCARWVPPLAEEEEQAFSKQLSLYCEAQELQEALCVLLRTPPGVDLDGLVAQAAAQVTRQTLLLDTALLPKEEARACYLIAVALREVRLRSACVMFKGLDELQESRRNVLAFLSQRLAEHPLPIIVLTPFQAQPPRLGRMPHVILDAPRVKMLSAPPRIRQQLLGLEIDDSVDLASLSRRYPVQAEHWPTLAQEASLYALQAGTGVKEEDLRQALRLRTQQDFGALARRLEPTRTFEDLIVSAELQQQLKEILTAVRYRELALDSGFAHKLGRATGISALFFGDSGTGKTMAAEVLAGALGVDLIQVDLSTVINKYIGETEKHLAKIFDLAEADSGVLFFDEADALFGKRTETQDAHDRHANIEVSYLLQRLERHPGLIILSTNNRSHLDTAFNRRLTFITRFSFPDAGLRERLWRAVWPPEIPLSETIDFAHLARRAELTGANIRNIALLATWLAIGDSAECIEERHIEQGLKREMNKVGRICS